MCIIYLKKVSGFLVKMGPGPRFEPESRDPQSRRITNYPTPAFCYEWMQGQGFEPW